MFSSTSIRRILAAVLLMGALAVPLTGCSSGSKRLAELGGLAAAHHLTSSKTYAKISCAYHTYRAYEDFKHGHHIFGALQSAAALHQCEKVWHQLHFH